MNFRLAVLIFQSAFTAAHLNDGCYIKDETAYAGQHFIHFYTNGDQERRQQPLETLPVNFEALWHSFTRCIIHVSHVILSMNVKQKILQDYCV
jgi:hypothetical protein